MPLAISLFAVGVIWRIMYQQDPDRGAINAGIAAIKGEFTAEGVLTQASPSTDDLTGRSSRASSWSGAVQPGDVAKLGLTAIRVPEIPEDAAQAVEPEPLQGGITGVVWRDFKPGGGTPGEVEPGELGLPGVTVELRNSRRRHESTSVTTEANGDFAFEQVASRRVPRRASAARRSRSRSAGSTGSATS